MRRVYNTEIGRPGSDAVRGTAPTNRPRRPALIVLDEPNSSLDAGGERALNRAIVDMKASGSTIVVMAHRPMLIAQLDRILPLQEGQVQMFGPREAVLAQLRRPRDPGDQTAHASGQPVRP